MNDVIIRSNRKFANVFANIPLTYCFYALDGSARSQKNLSNEVEYDENDTHGYHYPWIERCDDHSYS